MKKLITLISSFLVLLMLLPGVALAQEITNQEKNEINQVILVIERAINDGDADAIVGVMSANIDPLIRQAIEETVAGKSISFNEEVIRYTKTALGEVEVMGRFSAEGANWNLSGLSNQFTFTNNSGGWQLLNTNFHEKFDVSSILKIFLKVGAIIFLPLMILSIFWFWMLIDAAVRPIQNKVIWVLVIFFFNMLGALIYFFSVRRSHKKELFLQTGQASSGIEKGALTLLGMLFMGSIIFGAYSSWEFLKSSGILEPGKEGTPFTELMEGVELLEEAETVLSPVVEDELKELGNEIKEITTEETHPKIEEEPLGDIKEEKSETELESTFTQEVSEDLGLNSRGDRIYLDENTNAWIEYKSGETLQLTKNAGTTKGCGTQILYYKDPALSDDSQYALLPLYCEGDPTEVWIKEVSTFKSKKIAEGELGEFISEGAKIKIQVAGHVYPNPYTDLCSQEPEYLESGSSIHPISPRYSQLKFLGQLFTAAECGSERLADVWGVNGDNYRLGIFLNLKAHPDAELQIFLESVGFSCAEYGPVETCQEWTRQGDIPVQDLLNLKPYADLFSRDDCVSCG
jgi:hypothetical protein